MVLGRGGLRSGRTRQIPWLRRSWLQLRTLLGGRPGGFFIPYRHAAAVTSNGYPALEPRFQAAVPAMIEVVAAIESLRERLLALRGPAPTPRWDQDWFPRLDAAALYAIVRLGRPRRIVEIGSGHSTRFMVQAVSDGGFPCRIVCIDPQPRAEIGSLPVELRRRLFGPADATLGDSLEPGDILFVDSSHVAMPGTDVDLILNQVLPRLRPGVLVHLHDIFLPDAYPSAWRWRGYNEQIPVACLLQAGGWEIRFASHYLLTRCPHRMGKSVLLSLPLSEGAFEASLWLQRRG
jgi:predicted O-methyltransferase YrrM